MISLPFSTHNLISWLIQVSVIASLGVALPLLFRLRHPKTQLAYCHMLLVVCIILPLIEPWRHPLLILAGGTVQTAARIQSGFSWPALVGWIIAAGIVARLGWLASGLWQIRRYRTSAAPVFPIPDSIRRARELTRADARFGISRHIDGPATVGHIDPMVLLPESFPMLDHEAQLSIACHELLHVKRNDWMVTLVEEIAAALFWFHPAIWLLLSQAKLSREQIVDAEVVTLTSAPAPYVQALLVMAGAAKSFSAIPAALFLTEGHLPRRVRALLSKHRNSGARLFLSYVSIAALLTIAAWCAMVWFPLTGDAQTVEAAALAHIHPPILVARAKAPTSETNPSTFTIRVPGPEAPAQDTLFYSRGTVSGPEPNRIIIVLRPPSLPSPPFPGPFGVLAGQGIRLFRPGDRVTSEEIADMQAAIGARALLEVTQNEDGTVRRITLQGRRLSDEIHTRPFNLGSESDSAIPADSTGAADSVH